MGQAVTIYHNARCSKSRQTLELLKSKGIEPTVINYLDGVLDEKALRTILKQLGLKPIELMRTKEAIFKELNLAAKADNDQAMIQAMLDHPLLIERPIVTKNGLARIGRPPESVLEII